MIFTTGYIGFARKDVQGLREIQNEVIRLYRKYKTSNPYEIADAMGIIVHRMDLGKTRGFCYTSRRIKQIILNNDMPEWMERFVLAHELGHLIMHPTHNAPFLQTTFFSMDKYEVEANNFAFELLAPWIMDYTPPEHIIDSYMKDSDISREFAELRCRAKMTEMTCYILWPHECH